MNHVRTSVLLLTLFTLTISCSNRTPLPGLHGFEFGMNRDQILAAAKNSGFLMNPEYLSYRKKIGKHVGYARLILDDASTLRAIDIRGLPCKRPEDAREVMFQWKDVLERQFGPASPEVMSHPNFEVVNYVWRFSNATIYLGTTVKSFRTMPRILAIRN